jgi:transposase
VNQQHLFDPVPCNKYDLLTREELIALHVGEQKMRIHFQKENEELKKSNDLVKQKSFLIEDQLVIIKNKLFGKSSEKSPKASTSANNKDPKTKRIKVQLPSLRYPNAPLIEKDIELATMPSCKSCGTEMKDSGMTEDSEYLTAVPRQFYVVRAKRHIYRCTCCHGDLKTAPALPRIKEGSSYSDEMVVDVALSKYCDLIPIDRYVAMAKRAGIMDLPPNSLIQLTHHLADFVEVIYEKLKLEITSSKVLHADETPHRMLEGDEKTNWSLWGFSTTTASYFEAHNTRSGDVASGLLKDSSCEFLITDVFSGYIKAVRETNVYRKENNLKEILSAYCNAHARRKFNDSLINFEAESKYFIKCYKKIYHLEDKNRLTFEKRRAWQAIYFKLMERRAVALRNSCSEKSSLGKAIRYLINNFLELTLFLKYSDVPIDNNAQERLMRNPVIGRKTWYGTHSKRGAKTATILFSIIESCKLNKINPRIYFQYLVESIHQKKLPLTPIEYAKIADLM